MQSGKPAIRAGPQAQLLKLSFVVVNSIEGTATGPGKKPL